MEVAKAKQLGFFTGIKLTHLGKRDGKMSLPRKDETGLWNSAYMQKEVDSLAQYISQEWENTEKANANPFSESERIRIEMQQDKKFLENLLLTPPKEWKKTATGDYFTRKQELEKAIDEMTIRFSELTQQIAEREHITRLNCEKAANHCKQRIDAYWCGVLKKHTLVNELPPIPPGLPDMLASEKTYFSHHNSEER
jgi:hypothetical protein